MQTTYVRGRGNTIMPLAGAHLYKTFQVAAPIQTHFRKATCEEVGCLAHHYGWQTTVDESTDQGPAQAYYIRNQSGRRFKEEKTEAGLTCFTFEPGQTCFDSDQHVTSLERPYLFVVRDGDWRGNPRHTRPYRHANGDDWCDNFANHLDRLPR